MKIQITKINSDEQSEIKMELELAIKKRRSIRRFTEQKFPDALVQKAFELAVLAPNSSNIQNWKFHWVKSDVIKKKMAEACLNQSAARTASHLVVASIDVKAWKKSNPFLIDWVKSSQAPKQVVSYYEKLIPFVYTTGIFNILAPVKWLMFNAVGLFKPMMRRPTTHRDLQEVAIKSSALACENFVLSVTASGGATCMMEGFDECRVKKILGLDYSARIVMVIAVGFEAENGTWGAQYRLPMEHVLHVI